MGVPCRAGQPLEAGPTVQVRWLNAMRLRVYATELLDAPASPTLFPDDLRQLLRDALLERDLCHVRAAAGCMCVRVAARARTNAPGPRSHMGWCRSGCCMSMASTTPASTRVTRSPWPELSCAFSDPPRPHFLRLSLWEYCSVGHT